MNARTVARAAADTLALVDALGGTVATETRDAIESAISSAQTVDDWQPAAVDLAELAYAAIESEADPGTDPAIAAALLNDHLRSRFLEPVRTIAAKHMADAVADNLPEIADALDTAYQLHVVTPLLPAITALGEANVQALARAQLTGHGPDFDDPALDDVQAAHAAHQQIVAAYLTLLDRADIGTADELFLWADPGETVSLAVARGTYRLPLLAADIGMALSIATPEGAAARQAQAVVNTDAA